MDLFFGGGVIPTPMRVLLYYDFKVFTFSSSLSTHNWNLLEYYLSFSKDTLIEIYILFFNHLWEILRLTGGERMDYLTGLDIISI